MSKEQPSDIKVKTNPRVPVVGPGGQFKEPRVGPHANTMGGACIAVYVNGRAQIFDGARREGWDLYEDICRGNYKPINGGEPIAAPEYFAKWEKARDLRADDEDGQIQNRLRAIPDDFYHPEIYERRAQYEYGAKTIDLGAELAGDKPKKSPGRPKKGGASAQA